MTSPSTIAKRVAQMHATMAADPPAEPIGAFAREQAGLAASVLAGIALVGTVLPDAELLDVHGAATTLFRRSRERHLGPGLLPGRLVPVLQHRPVRLPGPAAPAADRTRHPARRD
jgi:hypothetical protein